MPQVLNHPLIAQRYFFPTRIPFPNPFWVEREGVRLSCYSHRPLPGAPTVVHFHGNGEVVSDYLGDFLHILESMGANVFIAEYRGYSMSDGSPQLGEMLDDVVAMVNAIGEPAEKLIFFGRSVGSIFALEAAHRFPTAAGLILESGIADPLERILLRVSPGEMGTTLEQLQLEVRQRLDHRAKIGGYGGPTLILHTRHDGLVDVSHGERLHAWAGGKKQLRVFANGNHNDIMLVNAAEYFELVRKFVSEVS